MDIANKIQTRDLQKRSPCEIMLQLCLFFMFIYVGFQYHNTRKKGKMVERLRYILIQQGFGKKLFDSFHFQEINLYTTTILQYSTFVSLIPIGMCNMNMEIPVEIVKLSPCMFLLYYVSVRNKRSIDTPNVSPFLDLNQLIL